MRSTRAIVAAFVDLLYRRKRVREAFMTYVAPEYIQHNPSAFDGRDAAIALLEPMFARPGFTIEVKRVLVDGAFAVVHLHGRPTPEARGGAVVDLYRLEDGLIVEHWDVKQDIPEHSVNPHPFF